MASGCTTGEGNDSLRWVRAGLVQARATGGCQESNENHTESLGTHTNQAGNKQAEGAG